MLKQKVELMKDIETAVHICSLSQSVLDGVNNWMGDYYLLTCAELVDISAESFSNGHGLKRTLLDRLIRIPQSKYIFKYVLRISPFVFTKSLHQLHSKSKKSSSF